MFVRILCGSLLLLTTVALSQPKGNQPTSDLEQFVRWLPGTYSSAALARRDTAFTDVQIRIVPIWPTATDGYWFYLEQAYATRLNAPYRQAILHVTSDAKGRIVSANHGLKNRQAFVGAATDSLTRNRISRADLDPEPPCNIVFGRKGVDFIGGTEAGGCPNTYRNATYFTNESVLTERSLYSWDKGLDKHGQQVWGARNAGYTFDKLIN